MNDAMSLGVHRLWKREYVNSLGTFQQNKVFEGGVVREEPFVAIDVAGGTGDIAFKIWEKATEDSAARLGEKVNRSVSS